MLGLILFVTPLKTVAAALPSQPTHNYYDQVGLLTSTTKDLVVQKNNVYDRSTQRPQIMLAVIKSTDGDSIDSYAPDLFSKWGLGQKSRDNGVLILYAVNDGQRNVRIEVGYGLEGELTDALSGRILQRSKSKLKSSDPQQVNQGLQQVFNSVATVIDKKYDFKKDKNTLTDQEYQQLRHQQNEADDQQGGSLWTIVVIVVVVIVLMGGGGRGGRGGGGMWWLWALLGSGNRNNHGGFGGGGGFGGSSGGGFSGGGGSSGGGGASI